MHKILRWSLIIGTFLAIVFMTICPEELNAMTRKIHVVLLGASVGNDWKIDSLPARLNHNGRAKRYRFEYVGEYQYDKSRTLREVLNRKQRRPDAVILKECAAYFPGNLVRYQELMKIWIRQCKESGVIPIPATVLPVIKQESLKSKMKDAVKILMGRPPATAQLEQIARFNDWLKEYAARENIIILDLESSVRVSPQDRSLRMDLHSGDGLHLNRAAYDILDEAMITGLEKTFQHRAARH